MADNKTHPSKVSVAALIDALPEQTKLLGRQAARQVDARRSFSEVRSHAKAG